MFYNYFALMYFKVSMRHNPAKNFIDGYYRLVESYRNADDRICHRTLLNVGFMEDITSGEQLNKIQKILTHKCSNSTGELFEVDYEETDPVVLGYIDRLYEQLVLKGSVDISTKQGDSKRANAGAKKDWQTIDINSLRNRDVREIGSEWLCFQALGQLNLLGFLSGLGWEEEDINLAMTHIISRAVYPASELETVRWIRENSSVCEITGYPIEKITKDRLYKISLRLFAIKLEIEEFLSFGTNTLFDITDKIVIYDLTNFFFEGRKNSSSLARFGRSKEKRNDCKLVVLALVVNPEGFIKYSSILEGNVSDPSTLESMINDLRLKTSANAKKAVIVMDAGIATDSNLKLIREKGYDYLCVTRSTMKDYILHGDKDDTITVRDNRKQKIALQKVSSSKNDDYYLRVESETKKRKERSMNDQFQERFETGLKKIVASLTKKGGIKQEDKVHERVGRLKQKYPSIQRHYLIEYEVEVKESQPQSKRMGNGKQNQEQRVVKAIRWTVKETDEINQNSGVYFLRTSIEESERILWETYNTIREIEYTNRVLKKDLDLRPIYHQKDESTMAHLHLGLLAYQVVNTIRFQLKMKYEDSIDNEIHCCWKEIVRIMNTQKVVTTTAQNKSDEVIIIRRCSEPNEKVQMIYDKLKYKYTPFTKKKSVVHKQKFRELYPNEQQEINSA